MGSFFLEQPVVQRDRLVQTIVLDELVHGQVVQIVEPCGVVAEAGVVDELHELRHVEAVEARADADDIVGQPFGVQLVERFFELDIAFLDRHRIALVDQQYKRVQQMQGRVLVSLAELVAGQAQGFFSVEKFVLLQVVPHDFLKGRLVRTGQIGTPLAFIDIHNRKSGSNRKTDDHFHRNGDIG